MVMKALGGIGIAVLVSFFGALWSCNAMINGLVAENRSQDLSVGLAAYGYDLTVQPVWADSFSKIDTPQDIQPAIGYRMVQ